MSTGTTQQLRGNDGEVPDLRARVQALAQFDAKLSVPQLRPGIIGRSALVDRARSGEPVIVISAPAGYGKTTLLTQWAAVDERAFPWLTITEGDNDPTVFVAYLIRALDAVDPLPPETLASFLSGAPGATSMLPRLGRTLLERSRPFVLALDDVHLLTSPDSIKVLEVLVSHLPDGSQLAIATRQDPPLARARLRTRRTLMELRAADLAFSASEGADLLRDAGLKVDDDAADALVERAEGWAAGIYLAALAVRDHPDPSQAASRFGGNNRFVAEYLKDELIEGLTPEVVEFLVRTSVLEYFDGPACDAVLERSNSWSVLEDLARSNLFVVPLDATGTQYRYHHLFADLLRSELSRRDPELERALHERASALFESRLQPNLAIHHARLAGDVSRAAGIAWRSAPEYLGTARAATVERWLAHFTPEELATNPALAVVAAWCCVSTPETRPIDEWIETARLGDPELVLPGGTPLGAAVSLLEAVAGEQGLRPMVEAAARAHQLDQVDSYYRPLAMMLEGSGLLLLGEIDDARTRLEAVANSPFAVPGSATTSLAQLALIAASAGDWDEAKRRIAPASALVEEHSLSNQAPQALVFATMSYVSAHFGDGNGARQAALQSRRLIARLNRLAPWMGIEARVVLSRAELVLGEIDAARVLAREARDLVARIPDAGVLPDRIESIFAEIATNAQGDSMLGAAPLTTAELRVLAYLPTHLSFQAIAEDLFVSRNTVKTQAIAIYRKLGVSSRGDAVERSRELGLLED